jgi:tRNA pseudouridine38-40 synthase
VGRLPDDCRFAGGERACYHCYGVKNILLQLAFVGSNYSGWQRQRNAASVQETLEAAITEITGLRSALVGCSRTDAGVHAEKYIANFHTSSRIPPAKFAPAIQSRLPADIFIESSAEIGPEFNSRRDSYEKTYRYQVFQGRSPFRQNRYWQLGERLDLEQLRATARLIEGVHDFSGFCVTRSLKVDNHCAIKQAAWRKENQALYFKITGDRFLHRMVRFLVGAQVQVASGIHSQKEFAQMLAEPRRLRAPFPAPPEGLYLMDVKFRKTRRLE